MDTLRRSLWPRHLELWLEILWVEERGGTGRPKSWNILRTASHSSEQIIVITVSSSCVLAWEVGGISSPDAWESFFHVPCWDREHADCTERHFVLPAHPLLAPYVITVQENTLVGIWSPCIIGERKSKRLCRSSTWHPDQHKLLSRHSVRMMSQRGNKSYYKTVRKHKASGPDLLC